MPGKIFLCYRHDDSIDVTHRIREKLEVEFERDLHFVGLDSVLGGRNFDQAVKDEVTTCDALLIFIGPNWSDNFFDDGMSRMAMPTNATRVAVATALDAEKTVIPILLDGARMPSVDNLPDDMKPMTYYQAISLRSEEFDRDVEHVCQMVRRLGSSVLGVPIKRKSIDTTPKANGDCIFISYRRNDSAPSARDLYIWAKNRFGKDKVFMDVDSIMHGTDFRSVLDDYVDRSAVVLAVIGKGWLGAERDGKQRLQDPSDFVRMELSTSLRRDKPVIPIVLDGAKMPTQAELPADLKALPFRHAIFLTGDIDAAQLAIVGRALTPYSSASDARFAIEDAPVSVADLPVPSAPKPGHISRATLFTIFSVVLLAVVAGILLALA